jgi:inorganic pyrophosphatase
LTYKQLPSEENACEITNVYGREEAHEVINRAMVDYQNHFIAE